MSHYGNNVPKGWTITTLGEAFTLQAGKNIAASEIHEASEIYHYPCFGGNGIRGYVDTYNRNGHYPIIGRQGALCGNVNEAQGQFYATEHAVVVETYARVDVNWVIVLLKALNLNQYATATAQPGLSVATINDVEFCLPPLEEQSRIAAKLDKCLSTIDALESEAMSLELSISKTKSKILELAISGKLVPQDPTDEPAIGLLRRINPAFKPCDNPHYPYVIPESWQFVALGDITTFLSRGKSPKYSEEKLYPVFAQKCNQWEGITLEKVQFLEPDTLRKWPEEYKLQDGDVLVNSTGTGTLGRTGIFYTRYLGNYPFILPDSHVTVIRGNKVLISQEYLYLVSRSAYMQKWMVDNMVGSTNQKELYPKALEGFLLALPPRAEQDRIVSFAKMILENVEALAIGL